MTPTSIPSGTLHRLMCCGPAVARRLLSGLNARRAIQPLPLIANTSLPVAYSQIVAPWSFEAASHFPFGLNVTSITALVGQFSVRTSAPLAVSQTFRVQLWLPAASLLPSGLKATV